KRYATWLVSHSINVAIFTIKIGVSMKYDREKLTKLGLAALLHDVGMINVPNNIIFKHGRLTASEFAIIKQHPNYGYEIVKHLKSDYPNIVDVVLQEQEREDGSGYPQGLTGDKISEFAKVVGLADVFEALVHGRAYREGFITYNAIQKIIESRGKQFNAKIIRALINGVSMFPVGSMVKLSTDEIARVLSVNSQRPVRPVVEVLIDSDGNKIKNPIRLNLEEEPLIYIVKPLIES
ncbi:MAG: HD-GYP domain-containing protein, partial [Candidatus Marinimicrobia bacterium]|nr:HD-GYP domain-containing protein [Candidatus Neomarinimicrobiota bacterium]